MRALLITIFIVISSASPYIAHAQPNIPMPWPQQFITLQIEGKSVRMAYMDIQPTRPNGQSALLLHGKNFNGFYWREVAIWLALNGFRVIVPDQLGFGNSDYPDIHYSFHLLSYNTAALLDSLGIDKTVVIGHSMGGMLATRFTLMYPQRVTKLVLENPIGLEDYKTFVPYTTTDAQYQKEQKATYTSYRDYQKSYYPIWQERFDTLVRIQAMGITAPNFQEIARANALTYQMIYEQPVVYEFNHLSVPTLLVIGSEDRTVVGKSFLSKEQQHLHGHYPTLAQKTAAQIKGSKLLLLPGVGHIPHIQNIIAFRKSVAPFLGITP
jgi:pimeloyl-ACP methyl ester carboxylesterase